MAGVGLTSVCLLLTGVTLNLYSQQLNDLKIALPEAHLFPTVKFIASLVFATFAKWRGPPSLIPPNPRQRRLMTLIGVLDAAAYLCFCIGFTHTGTTLANLVLAAAGQLFTALATRFILRKHLSRGQLAAIACVGLGLAIRALPASIFISSSSSKLKATAAGASSTHSSSGVGSVWGVAFIVFSALLYSGLGIAYEALMAANNGKAPAYPDILWHISIVGATGAIGYQIVYVAPRWSTLVGIPMEATKLSITQIVKKLLLFGGLFNLHMFTQSRVLKSEGALGVSLVNSVRGAVIAVLVGLLMCSAEKPGLCLTLQSGLSAAVTTIGGLAWVLAGDKAKKAAAAKKKKKGEEEGKIAIEKNKNKKER